MTRRFGPAAALIFALAACGGGDSGAAPEVAATAQVGDPQPGATECLTAMTDSLVAAFRASDGAKNPDEAFAEAAGKLPSPCRLLDGELLKTLLDQATQAAITLTTGPETQPR